MTSKGYQKVTAPVDERYDSAAAIGAPTMHQAALVISVSGNRSSKQSSAMIGGKDSMRKRGGGSGQD
ncbi:MAG: hypothetical protein AAGA21_10745 [Pseudomonadota bacterium]